MRSAGAGGAERAGEQPGSQRVVAARQAGCATPGSDLLPRRPSLKGLLPNTVLVTRGSLT